MEIFYATQNLGKVKSLQDALSGYKVTVSQIPMNLPEPRSDDVEKIAKEKVLYGYEEIKKPTVALDAGFYIDSLNGFPKAFVNFALDTIGVDGIIKLLEGEERTCEFRHCLAYMDEELEDPMFFQDHVRGKLSEEKLGEMGEHLWSDLSLVFIPKDTDKTLAQMSYNEYLKWKKNNRKNSYSEIFGKWLLENRI